MATAIPQKLHDLFQFDRPIVATLITLMPDGAPQATPVWFLYEDDQIIVNTARGRQKDRNMQRDAKVAMTIIDPKDPYHWAEVRGTITDIVEATGDRDIDRLSLKYTGNPEYQFRKQGEVRVTYKIAVQKVNGS